MGVSGINEGYYNIILCILKVCFYSQKMDIPTTEEMITASIYRQTFAKKVKWTALHFSLMDDRMSL